MKTRRRLAAVGALLAALVVVAVVLLSGAVGGSDATAPGAAVKAGASLPAQPGGRGASGLGADSPDLDSRPRAGDPSRSAASTPRQGTLVPVADRRTRSPDRGVAGEPEDGAEPDDDADGGNTDRAPGDRQFRPGPGGGESPSGGEAPGGGVPGGDGPPGGGEPPEDDGHPGRGRDEAPGQGEDGPPGHTREGTPGHERKAASD